MGLKIRLSKKAVFFTIDAILATSIIVMTIVMASSFYIKEKNADSNGHTATDLIRVLSSIKVGEIENSYVKGLVSNGTLTKVNISVAEQIGELWAAGDSSLAAGIIKNITEPLVPERLGLGLWINDEQVYKRSKAISKSLVSSRKIISGIAKEKPVESYVSRTYLTGIKEKPVYSYAYFGGYTGDGNVSVNIRLPDEYTNITEMYLEMQINSQFSLYINGLFSGNYTDIVTGQKRADSYVVDLAYYTNLKTSWNDVTILFTNATGHIGGGFVRVKSTTENTNFTGVDYSGAYVTKKDYLPGIKGVINLYSSFFIPGDIQKVEMYLNYSSNYPLFVNFGNITVYESNLTGDVNSTVNHSYILARFGNNLSQLSRKTVPLRIGHFSTDKSRYSDTMLCTDLSASMDTADVPPDNEERLEVTKEVEKQFIEYVFNISTRNYIGLVGYYATTPSNRFNGLTNQSSVLKDKIDNSFFTLGSDNSCFACALKRAEEEINANSGPGQNRAIIIMSDGYSDKCYDVSPCSGNSATAEAISIACSIHQDSNISIYAIGFGIGADNTTLKNISVDCGGGLFFHSYNETGLLEVFKRIADNILTLGFTKQIAVSENVYSSISKDSYIYVEYAPDVPPYIYGKMAVTVEQPPFGNAATTGSIDIMPNATVTNAKVTSYSGDEWTDIVNLSGNEVFDLSDYNGSYPEMGDPFLISLPSSLLTPGSNSISIKTASDRYPQNETGGSEDDRAIYDMLIDTTVDFSASGEFAQGCNWTIKYEDDSTEVISVPAEYSGENLCNYEDGIYDEDDAIQAAFNAMLQRLDTNSNMKIDFKFEEESLFTKSVIIPGVPTLWGPSIIDIRVWE